MRTLAVYTNKGLSTTRTSHLVVLTVMLHIYDYFRGRKVNLTVDCGPKATTKLI